MEKGGARLGIQFYRDQDNARTGIHIFRNVAEDGFPFLAIRCRIWMFLAYWTHYVLRNAFRDIHQKLDSAKNLQKYRERNDHRDSASADLLDSDSARALPAIRPLGLDIKSAYLIHSPPFPLLGSFSQTRRTRQSSLRKKRPRELTRGFDFSNIFIPQLGIILNELFHHRDAIFVLRTY